MVHHRVTSPDGKSRWRAKRAERPHETLLALGSCSALLGGGGQTPEAESIAAVSERSRGYTRTAGARTKEGTMPIYVMLSSLTPEGSKTLHARPDRLEEV